MPIYIDSVPYMKTLQKQVSLPKGNPTMYGNIVFLLSNSIKNSVDMINNKTISNDNKYYYYYYEMLYRGTLNYKRYNIRDIDGRDYAYLSISKRTTLNPHPFKPLNSTKYRNTYFELCKYLEIFSNYTNGLSVVKTIEEYWKYIKEITSSSILSGFTNKFILVDINQYTNFKGKLKDLISNPVYLLYYTLYRYFDLISNYNIDFLLYSNKYILKINPSKCDEKSYIDFIRELKKLFLHTGINIDNEINLKEIDKEIIKDEVKNKIIKKYNFVGDNITQETEDSEIKKELTHDTELAKKITSKVDNVTDNMIDILGDDIENIDQSEIENYIEVQVDNDISEDDEIINDMYNYNISQKFSKSPISSKRDEELRKKQKDIKIKNMTLNDISKINTSTVKIPKKDISKSIKSINKNMQNVKFANFEKTYNEEILPVDIANVFTSLNNKSIPMYVVNVTVEDTSDTLNYKETYHVTFEDENRKRHTVTVDVPKFLEDKFLYLGGNKKIIMKQNFLYPVVKTGPDVVQMVSNYNKLFIYRIGTRSLGIIERIMKFVSKNDKFKSYFKFGNASIVNSQYLSFIEYDELSKSFIEFNCNGCHLIFNQKDAIEYAEKHSIKIPDSKIFVGTNNNEHIFIDYTTQETEDGKTISEILISSLPDELQSEFSGIRSGKRLMYTSATILQQSVPLICILCYWEGLTTVLKKANVKYRLSEKLPRNIGIKEYFIKFNDCYIIYEDDIITSLLMNGLNFLNCSNYSLSAMDTPEPYVDLFKNIYGKINIINALTNFYEFFIDPITKEILNDINLPDDFVSLAIYANSLLADNAYTKENKQYLYRIRSNEIVPAILYYIIAENYIQVRNSGGKKKLSVPKDALIKKILELQTVEDYSTLNPIVEIEKTHTISAKGWRGANVQRAYTIDKRSYDPTMMGIMAISSSPDSNVGVTRTLTMEPMITTARGYVDIKEDENELKDVNLFSAAELVTSLSVVHDDSPRTAMATKQSKHVIPTAKSSPVLISNGAEESIRFNLSSDFIVNAKDDGEVIEKNDKTNIMVVKYKDGSTQAIDLSKHIVKNGAGGFYLTNQLLTNYNTGDKFKKDDLLAYHKDFFTNTKLNGGRLNMGPLTKVAVMSSYNTYEDSCFVTNKLSNDSASDLVFQETAIVGKNANIDFIKNIGDHVEIGDIIMQFDTSFEESELNKFLNSLSDELQNEINESSKNAIKCKHSGIIEDIKIYPTVDLEEMSSSLRKIVDAYYNKINSKKKMLDKYDKTNSVVKCGMLLNESTDKVKPNQYGLVKGANVGEGVLFEFYIRHTDTLGVGDKIAYFAALKSIIGEVIPEGYEPYSEFRPDEEVSSTIAPGAILRRMTPSIIITMFGNKDIIELKRKLKDIYMS